MSAYAHSHPDFPRDFSRREPLFTPDCPALAGGECAACEAMDPHHGHLNKVAYWAGKFAEEMFPKGSDEAKSAQQWGYLARLWHDLGKCSEEFQKLLWTETKRTGGLTGQPIPSIEWRTHLP